MSAFINKTFDDRDTDHLKYQGFWFLTGSWNASNVGQTGTLSSTSDLNANVTFTFPEPAIAFYYFGIPRCCGGQYGVCIDCDPNQPNFIQVDGVNATDDGKNPPIALFSKRFDTPGIHEIIIRNENDPRFGKSQLTIDGIVLEVPNASASSSSSSSSSSNTPTSGASSGSPSPTPTGSDSSTPIGAIVGGILGALAFLLAMIILAFWIRVRRRRARKSAASEEAAANNNNNSNSFRQHPGAQPASYVQPFNQLSPSLSMPTLGSGSGVTTSAWDSSAPLSMGAATHGQRHRGHAAGAGHAPFQSVSTFSDATSSGIGSTSAAGSNSNSGPRRERDAGPAPLQVEEDQNEEVLPPDYGDVFAASRRASAAAGHSLSLQEQVQVGNTSPEVGGQQQQVSIRGQPSAGLSPIRRKN